MPLASGSPFGAYDVLAPLGAGGMGEVYRAKDRRLGREVALKILPTIFAADPDRLARFEREAQLLASLNHPNIATIHGVEQADGVHGLVLELIEGETLADRIARGPCPLHEALRVAGQLIDALEAAHEKGIVHRDLKPANIKLTRDGLVKVLDFGLAKALDSGARAPDLSQSPTITASGTRAGVILGTAAYMSPEQARGHVVDKRTDIWAFGCVLYELLTGRAAYQAATVSDTLVAVLEREPDWNLLPADTPAAVIRVLRRCLTKDMRRRVHDIADVRLDLDDAPNPGSNSALGVPSAAATPMARARWIERAAWIGLVGVAGALAAWVVYVRSPVIAPQVVEVAVYPAPGTTFVRALGGPWPRISPDGSTLAFVALSAGKQQIWIRSLDSAAARPLEGTDEAVVPFWSPDSQSIGFFANGELRRIDLASRAVRVLADVPYSGGLAGSWGDGVIVFNGAGSVLHRVPANGGAFTQAVESPEALDTAVPSFLPDRRQFLFLLGGDWSTSDVCMAALDARDRRCVPGPISPVEFDASGHLVFVRDGVLQAQRFDADLLRFVGEGVVLSGTPIDIQYAWQTPPFSISDNGVLAYYPRPPSRLAWFDRSGRQLEVLPIAGAVPAVSPDETAIVVERRDLRTLNTDLWLYSRARGTESRFTFDPASETQPAFSPDGTRVLYVVPGKGFFQKPVDGGAETSVANMSGGQPDWSDDGRFVAYMVNFDIWVAPLSGGGSPTAVARTPHGERSPALSPDSRWIAYDSTETGRREIWVQPFPPTGARWQISTTGGVSPQWRADGRELFYVAADGKLMAVTVTPGTTFRWDAPRALFETVFRGGTYAEFVFSRDGERVLMPARRDPDHESPITVVVNWPARLPR
jgi:Tol biopolymer transport system component